MQPKGSLIRVVRSPQGEVSVDLSGKKAGRGAYCCCREDCFRKAIKQKQLEHALVTGLTEDVKEELIHIIKEIIATKESKA